MAAGGGGGSERAEIERRAREGPWKDSFHEKHVAYGREVAKEMLGKLADGDKYVDEAFGPDDFFAGTSKEGLGSPYAWERYFESVAKGYMIRGGTTVDDLQQGHLGDCYLVASVASVANAGLVKRLLVTRTPEGKRGLVGVRLFFGGAWQIVWMDDRVPMQDGLPVLMRSTDSLEAWPAFVEKAIAKVCGGYQVLKSGSAADILSLLTALPTTGFLTKELGVDGSFARIRDDFASGAIACAGSKGDKYLPPHCGIAPKHFYSLLRAASVGGEDFVVLRNPWGRKGEFRGAYSDGDKDKWTPALKRALEHDPEKGADDGEFVMRKEDFRACFFNVNTAHLPPEGSHLYCAYMAAQPPCKHDASHLLQFPLKVKKRATLRIGVINCIGALRGNDPTVRLAVAKEPQEGKLDKVSTSKAPALYTPTKGGYSASTTIDLEPSTLPRPLVAWHTAEEPSEITVVIQASEALKEQPKHFLAPIKD